MTPTLVAAGRTCVVGDDQSVYQGANDYATTSSVRFWVGIKASGGDGGLYPDRMLPTHFQGFAGRALRSGYHFLGDGAGAAQADYFVRATNGYAGFELPPTVDVETYGPNGRYRPSSQTVRDFVNELEKLLPRRWAWRGDSVHLVVYSGKPLEGILSPLGDLVGRLPLWLAAYLNPKYGNPWNGVTNGDVPNVAALGSPDKFVPAPWREWAAWQFAGGDGGNRGVGNGVTNCDQDVMTIEAFRSLTTGQTTEEDEVTPEQEDAIAEKSARKVVQLLAAVDDDAQAARVSLGHEAHFQISGQRDAEAIARGEPAELLPSIAGVPRESYAWISGQHAKEAAGRGEPVGSWNRPGWPTLEIPAGEQPDAPPA